MAAIPIALIFAVLAATAHAQEVENVLCVQDDAYALCSPGEVFQASIANTPVAGTFLETTGSVFRWTAVPRRSPSDTTPLAPTMSGDAGTSGFYSRGDHAHPAQPDELPNYTVANKNQCLRVANNGMSVVWGQCRGQAAIPLPSDATPKPLSIPAAAGTASTYSRGDHSHLSQLPTNPAGSDNHFLRQKGNARSWQPGEIVPHFSSANKDMCAKVNSLGTGITWGACGSGGGGTPSDAIPQKSTASGAAGTATAYSRGDHAHPAELPDFSSAGGDVVTIKSDGSAIEYSETHEIVTDGLPAITGQAGNVLTVNSGATGVEWAAGGSAGGGGSSDWELAASTTRMPGASSQTDSFSMSTYHNNWTASTLSTAFRKRSLAAVELRVEEVNTAGLKPATTWSAQHWFVKGVPIDENIVNWTIPFAMSQGNTSESRFWENDKLVRANIWDRGNPINVTFPDTLPSLNSTTTQTISIRVLPSLGGGGGDNPPIPKPTPAGALQNLRVNAAGSAYELGVVAVDTTLIDELAESEEKELGKLLAKTTDLKAASSTDSYVTNTDTSEGLYIGAEIPLIEPRWSNEIDPPYPTTGRDVWVRLKKSSNIADYRLEIAFTSVSLESPGIDWETHDRTSLTHNYYLASRGFSGNTMSLKLQKHPDRAGMSTFSGLLDGKQITYIEGKTRGDLTIAVGRYWGVQQCTGSGDTHQCEADWIAAPAPPTPATRRELIANGTVSGGSGTYTRTFPQSGSAELFHNHIISGRYQELKLQVRWRGLTTGSEIIGCTFPGLAKGDLLNAQTEVRIHGYGSSSTGGFLQCGLTLPVTGNVTLTWNPGGRSGLTSISTWTLTGIRW